MFKRYMVACGFKSGKSLDTHTRAHTVQEAIGNIVGLFGPTDTLVSIVAKEEPEAVQTAPKRAKKGGKRPGRKPGTKVVNGKVVGPDGVATDHV